MNNVKSTENMKTKNLTEGRLDNRVSLSFRLGVMVSLALVVVGLALVAIAGAKDIEPTPPLSQLLEGILKLDAAAIITLGILTLLLTPVVQVIVALVTFSIDRDKLYLGVCITLLCVLAFSLVLALI